MPWILNVLRFDVLPDSADATSSAEGCTVSPSSFCDASAHLSSAAGLSSFCHCEPSPEIKAAPQWSSFFSLTQWSALPERSRPTHRPMEQRFPDRIWSWDPMTPPTLETLFCPWSMFGITTYHVICPSQHGEKKQKNKTWSSICSTRSPSNIHCSASYAG